MGKIMGNKATIEWREQKINSAKERAEIINTMQKEMQQHKNLMKKYKIAENALENSKRVQMEMSSEIKLKSAENAEMSAQINSLRNENDEYFFSLAFLNRLSKTLCQKKTEFDKKVVGEATKNMKTNKNDMESLLLEKYKKDSYTQQVLAYNKHLAVGINLRTTQERQLKEKLMNLEAEIERQKTQMEFYTEKKYGERSFKDKDLEILKGLLPKKKKVQTEQSCKCYEDDKGILHIAKFN